MTKSKKEKLKKKVFKISAIVSFIVNFFMLLFLLIGLLGSSSKPLSVSASNIDLVTDWESCYRENYEPFYNANYWFSPNMFFSHSPSSDVDYSDIPLNKTLKVRSTNSKSIGHFIDFKPNPDTSIEVFGYDYTIYSFSTSYETNALLSVYTSASFSNPTNFLIKSSTGANDYQFRFYDRDNISADNYELLIKYFYSSFYTTSSNDITFNNSYLFKPFVDMSKIKIGLPYFIDMSVTFYNIQTSVTHNDIRFSSFYVDIRNNVIGRSVNKVNYFIGSVNYDSSHRPYLEFFNDWKDASGNSMLNIDLFDGYFISYHWSSEPIADFFEENSSKVYHEVDGSYFINLDGSFLFNWTKFYNNVSSNPHSSSGYSYSYTVNARFYIKEFDSYFKQIIFYDDNQFGSSSHYGYISVINESGVVTKLYEWEFSGSPDSYDDVFITFPSFTIDYPYLYTFVFEDSYIFVNDYALISSLLYPTTVVIPPLSSEESMGGVFSLLGNAFTGAFQALNVEIFPGISLLTLMLIPLFVTIIIAIIKLIKG